MGEGSALECCIRVIGDGQLAPGAVKPEPALPRLGRYSEQRAEFGDAAKLSSSPV